jgi:hypothetical protein
MPDDLSTGFQKNCCQTDQIIRNSLFAITYAQSFDC